jgi:H+-transporting ATPase
MTSVSSDRASPALSPSRWRMRSITSAALVLGALKLSFSTTVLAFSSFRLRLFGPELQTLAFVTLVFGNQALLYALPDRRHLWSSKPNIWVVAPSAADIAITSALALSGTLMAPLPWRLRLAVLCVSAGFALLIDKIKLTMMAGFNIA